MVRTARYKYIVCDSGARREQLIDLEKDPGEMRNLAMDPAYAEILANHRRLLVSWYDAGCPCSACAAIREMLF